LDIAMTHGFGSHLLRARLALLGLVLFGAQARHTEGQDAIAPTRAIVKQARRFTRPTSVVVGKKTFYPYAFEGHVHTSHSVDARHSTVSILQAAERLGLDALIITDHGSSEALRDFPNYHGPLLPFIGREIGGVFGHAVIWNVDADDKQNPLHTSLQQRCKFAHDNGGLLVFAHPGWWIDGNGHDPMEWMTPHAMMRGGVAGDIDAIEIWNGVYRTPLPKLIDAWVGLLEAGVYVPIVGNSDFHRFDTHLLGSAYNIAFCDRKELASCLWPAVRAGRVMVSDGPYAMLSVNDVLPGGVITSPVVQLDVRVEASSSDGGTLQLYVGREVVRTMTLQPGEPNLALWHLPVPSADTFLRIDILREHKARGQTAISLLSNPVLIDVGPKRASYRLFAELSALDPSARARPPPSASGGVCRSRATGRAASRRAWAHRGS
jgi:hypothetical protein